MEGDGQDGQEGPDRDAADLRFTKQEGKQVRVERDLSGSGHLARGDQTRMSRLNFSARARPADPGERDAAFTARATEPAVPPPEPSAPVTPAPPATGTEPADTIRDRLGRLFGR